MRNYSNSSSNNTKQQEQGCLTSLEQKIKKSLHQVEFYTLIDIYALASVLTSEEIIILEESSAAIRLSSWAKHKGMHAFKNN